MVENAAWFLTRAPQATVPEAMHVVQFSKDDIADPNIRKQILQCLPGHKKPTASSVVAAPMSLVACSPMTTLESDITNNKEVLKCPPPKCVRIRKTAPAAMKGRVKDIKQKRHFSTAHKEATRLFAQECTKPGGERMSYVKVAEQNIYIYSVGPSAETIHREVQKGHVGTSPMKMGPAGCISRCNYKVFRSV
jgi:hypothetical protein